MFAACLISAAEWLAPRCHAQDLAAAQAGNVEQPKPAGEPASDPATQASTSEAAPGYYDNSLGMPLLKHIIKDQEVIWTSPARVRLEDSIWLIPLGGLTAGLIATDRDISMHITNGPQTRNRYVSVSNYGVAALAGGAGALYLWGHFTHNDHARESGLLAGEAAVDAFAVSTAVGYATGRNRPLDGDQNGDFFSGGDSFPSDHSAVAWSIASVLSHEYPGPVPTILAYGAATAVSIARVQSKQHFTSDVVVGDAIGWLIGEYVYRTHHDSTLGGGEWKSWPETLLGDLRYDRKNMGSPYVPMDSWIYPALDRLQALGFISEGFLGQRPWTRMECARLINDANDQLMSSPDAPPQVAEILHDLNDEFAREINLLGGGANLNARLESAYARVTDISGQPLSNGAKYDFGQTIVNDYGRPYEEGANVIAGGSGWATAGPLVGYARAEYQYAPSAPALPLEAREVIQKVQFQPAPPPGTLAPPAPPDTPTPTTSQADLLEGYVGLQFENWAFTFGKQEQWWGPDQSGPMIFSTNAEPIEMFQINRVTPFTLPSLFRYVGPVRLQFFLGRLSGQNWVYSGLTGYTGSWTHPLSDQPFIDGGKISIKPTPNFEMGMGVITIMAGAGVPMTLHKFGQSLLPIGKPPDALYGAPSDPGARRGGFDFTYRFPRLRNWLTLYADAVTDDEISPWRRWDKAAVTSGIYLPRIPKIPKLDFRAEGIYTDPPALQPSLQYGFYYYGFRFVSGDTNDGTLIGSWIGRMGQGADTWATYWLTPRSNLQLNFRHEKVSRILIPNGGTITDGGIRGSFWLGSTLSVSASVQYETWDFPVIAATQQANLATTIGVTFWPGRKFTAASGAASAAP